MPATLDFQNVSKWYGDFQVLNRCSTQVNKGEVVVVCGPSGSGKSTLIKCANGLEPFQQGSIHMDGISVGDAATNLPQLRARIGMVFQHFELFPHLSVTENLTLGQLKVLNRSADQAKVKALGLLERVGLSEHANKFPGQLSGGQQQRVAIARSLVNDPLLILADEPTGNLDSRTGLEVLELIDTLNASGKTIVLVTHDERIATRAHRVIHMRDGLIEREVVNRAEPAAPAPQAKGQRSPPA